MFSKKSFSGTWGDNKQSIDMLLSLISFEEDGAKIVYCPALDISGYGDSEQDANDSFAISLEEFFSYTTHKGTFNDELRRLGWKIRGKKPMVPPDMTKLLSDNENFSRIFNNHPFYKFDKEIAIPIA
jgi:hypothetical protein